MIGIRVGHCLPVVSTGRAMPFVAGDADGESEGEPSTVGDKLVDAFAADVERVAYRAARLEIGDTGLTAVDCLRNGFLQKFQSFFCLVLGDLETDSAD